MLTLLVHATWAADEQHPVTLAQLPDSQQQSLPMASLALRFGPLLPKLLGLDKPATYLLVVQNSDELRATGGFISAIGTLTVDNARIADLTFIDSTLVFRQDLTYPPAPPPMQRYMNIPLFLLRDANWSPDLPTTAKMVQSLYRRETGLQVDGIITIDLRAVELFVGALEPLTIEGANVEVTGATVVEQLRQLYDQPVGMEENASTENFANWWGVRKEFMPKLASSARTRLESGEADIFKLMTAAQTALTERSVQLWLADPQAQRQMAELGWDGGLHPPPAGDFLALVDTNMGYNKVDAVIERAFEYTVTWPSAAGQPALATATITYTHPITRAEQLCEAVPRYGNGYQDMIERCYFDYVRLYVPAGSKLVQMSGVAPDSVKSQRGEAHTQSFAGYFIMQPGTQHVVTVHYELPPALTSENYQLVVQRQAGTRPLPITLNIGDRPWPTTLAEGMLTWSPE